jgi:hypothetical protein
VSENPKAFPLSPLIDPDDCGGSGGMDLRDWFAGQALAGCMANPSIGDDSAPKYAYFLADAMLAERGRALSAERGE